MARFQLFSVSAFFIIILSSIFLLSVSNKSVVLANPVPLVVRLPTTSQSVTHKPKEAKKFISPTPKVLPNHVSVAPLQPVSHAVKEPFPSMEDCRRKFKVPAAATDDTYLYFSGFRTKKEMNAVKKYAVDHGLVHVGQFYPNDWTSQNRYEGTDAQRYQWQKDFSQVYAESTKGSKAYLITKNNNEPNEDSIFKSIEFLAMRDRTQVAEIIWLDANLKENPTDVTKTWWTRDGASSKNPPKNPPKSASNSCDVSYKFFYNFFEIRGKDFPNAKLGKDGLGLLANLRHCGAVTKWTFESTPHDTVYQWYASGELPIGTKNCVGDAVKKAGGSTSGNCNGAG